MTDHSSFFINHSVHSPFQMKLPHSSNQETSQKSNHSIKVRVWDLWKMSRSLTVLASLPQAQVKTLLMQRLRKTIESMFTKPSQHTAKWEYQKRDGKS